MQLKYDKLLGNATDQSDFWPSFTDMLTTILLVVILAFSLAVGGYASTVSEMKGHVEKQAEALVQAENQIKGILGVKGDIIDALESSFQENNIAVRIDPDTGDIHVDSNILFDYGSAQLKPAAKKHLQSFIPLYIETLFKYEGNLEEIIVEGHTDNSGGYMYNLKLSQDRALNVVSYILSDEFGDFEHKDKMRDRITANGRSFSHLVMHTDGTVNASESRRVVFKFRTTLENALKENLEETLQ